MGNRAIAAFFALAATALCPRDAAADQGFGVHLGYAIGGAFASETVGSGLRQGLDAFVGLGEFDVNGSSSGMWSSHSGWLIGPSLVTGFGAYPTYGAIEWARCEDTTLAGLALGVGPAMRFTPEPAGGLSLRAHGDLFFLQVGARVLAMVTPDPEAVLLGTIGLGRY